MITLVPTCLVDTAKLQESYPKNLHLSDRHIIYHNNTSTCTVHVSLSSSPKILVMGCPIIMLFSLVLKNTTVDIQMTVLSSWTESWQREQGIELFLHLHMLRYTVYVYIIVGKLQHMQ